MLLTTAMPVTAAKEMNEPARLSQVLWGIAGAVRAIASILSFCTSGNQLIQIMPWLGTALLLSGISNILVYFTERKSKKCGRWGLADGLTAALLSIFLLFNQMTPVAVLPFFFCVWELFSGVLRIMEALELRDHKACGWQWLFIVGVLEIFSGAIALLKPVEEALTMHVVIGIVLAIQAAAFLHKAFVILHSGKG